MSEPYTKIIVRNLHLDMHIGVYDHEKKAPQKVIVNVEADIPFNHDWQADSIDGTFSYEDIVQAASRIAGEGHIHLVETMAERIAEHCLTHLLVMAVKVRVEKPDIFPAADAAGVEIFRTRS